MNWRRKRSRRQGAPWAVLCPLALVLLTGLTACTFLFSDGPMPTLILGEVLIVGGRGELLLSVADMPDGGLASASVVIGGIIYNQAKVSNVAVEGLVGFEVMAEHFAFGVGGFMAVHCCAGLQGGGFAKLRFDVNGDVTLSDFVFTEAAITLYDDSNDSIAFEMTDEYSFYAK